MPYPTIDLSRVRTYSLAHRASRVALENLVSSEDPPPPFENHELVEVAERIVTARQAGAPVIFFFGGHVIKRGLAPVVIDLMERGVVTHLASNGAASIHDFEIALFGQTSEDVATSIEDGSFGMAEETGAYMNRAVRSGARQGLGMGEALGKWISENEAFRCRDYSLLYSAYQLGIPYTIHVAIGTDIIHQHPLADFAALGWATGQDFKVFTASVSQLEGGVFCNFGSAVMGPEVFLKALSISRNLGHSLKVITTANFDLLPLQDYRRPLGEDALEYYYRPRKNIIIRPTSLGGRGYHISGDHKVTLPNLSHAIRRQLGEVELATPSRSLPTLGGGADALDWLASHSPKAAERLKQFINRVPALQGSVWEMVQASFELGKLLRTGGVLYIACQPGFEPRWTGASVPEGIPRLRTLLLGHNPTLGLVSRPERGKAGIGRQRTPKPWRVHSEEYARELSVMAHSGDVLLCVCPESETDPILETAGAARALGLTVMALTGDPQSWLATQADIVIQSPLGETVAANWIDLAYQALIEIGQAMQPGGAI